MKPTNIFYRFRHPIMAVAVVATAAVTAQTVADRVAIRVAEKVIAEKAENALSDDASLRSASGVPDLAKRLVSTIPLSFKDRRQVVLSRYVLGMPIEKISACTGVRVENVKETIENFQEDVQRVLGVDYMPPDDGGNLPCEG